MDVLRSWIVTLVSITIVCSIIEKFAPQGNLNKYIKLICGLVVTVVIITPVINLLKGDLEIDSIAWSQYVKMSEKELKSRVTRLQQEDSGQILELYRVSLINDVKTRFKGHRDFNVTNVDAVLFEDPKDERFGLLRTLYINLEPADNDKSKALSNGTVDYIKNQLIAAFGIDENQIIIDLNAFNGG